MALLLFSVVLLMGVPVVSGFITSRRQRRENRRNFIAFVGFCEAVVALTATTVYFTAYIVWFQSLQDVYSHPARQGFIFISGCIALISSAVSFSAGLFSAGMRRAVLITFTPVTWLTYLFAAFSNFGK
jgi:hypothetical protein